MATSNKNNVTLRQDKTTPLTRSEMDSNFEEVKKVIDDATNNESNIGSLDGRLNQAETNITGLESGKVDVGSDISQNTVTTSTGTRWRRR